METHDRPRCIRIDALRESSTGGAFRVSAHVDGTPVWFESADVPLRAAPEAFATAFLIPALHQDMHLAVHAGVCPQWHDHVARLLPIANEWWGLPPRLPIARFRTVPDAGQRNPRAALCFSGGIDSFYSLLRSGERLDALVTAHGFDVALDDTARMTALSDSVEDVAAHLGLQAIRVRTNLRDHPLMQSVPWERAHGGALAALGHVLDGSIGKLLISSSIVRAREPEPWGSHWELDPLWSSSRLEVANIGSELLRTGKLRAIADEPLVRRHLRVCWENRTSAGNCSRCEKCLVARLKLVELGLLEAFMTFEGPAALVAHVDTLPRIKQLPRAFGELSASTALAPEVRRAVRQLIQRTRTARSLPHRLGRFLARQARSMLQTRR